MTENLITTLQALRERLEQLKARRDSTLMIFDYNRAVDDALAELDTVLAQATEPQGHILRGDTRFNEAARQWLESHNIVSPKMTKSLAELFAGLLRGASVVSPSESATILRQCQNCGRMHNLSDWVVQCECGGRTLRAVVSPSGAHCRLT